MVFEIARDFDDDDDDNNDDGKVVSLSKLTCAGVAQFHLKLHH